ncbi:7338_t:CDS:2, partial [Funneliformis caledonium]
TSSPSQEGAYKPYEKRLDYLETKVVLSEDMGTKSTYRHRLLHENTEELIDEKPNIHRLWAVMKYLEEEDLNRSTAYGQTWTYWPFHSGTLHDNQPHRLRADKFAHKQPTTENIIKSLQTSYELAKTGNHVKSMQNVVLNKHKKLVHSTYDVIQFLFAILSIST